MNTTPEYPAPDRSSVSRTFTKKSLDDDLDLSWYEGTFRDGRPYRKEYWANSGSSYLTYFFSSIGMEHLSDEQLIQHLVGEDLFSFIGEKRFFVAARKDDNSGNNMWSVNVTVGNDDGEIYLIDQRDLQPYER